MVPRWIPERSTSSPGYARNMSAGVIVARVNQIVNASGLGICCGGRYVQSG
jgi:hypothetical protein